MRVTAKVDYAVLAMVELAASSDSAHPLTAEAVAERQHIPARFLLNILSDLRTHRLVDSRRGNLGGYWIARVPSKISVADIFRAVEGPLADVHGTPPEDLSYPPPATAVRDVWLATRSALRDVLERTTLDQIVTGALPAQVTSRLSEPGALRRR